MIACGVTAPTTDLTRELRLLVGPGALRSWYLLQPSVRVLYQGRIQLVGSGKINSDSEFEVTHMEQKAASQSSPKKKGLGSKFLIPIKGLDIPKHLY